MYHNILEKFRPSCLPRALKHGKANGKTCVRRLEMGRLSARLHFNLLESWIRGGIISFPRDFESMAFSNNRRVKQISAEDFTTIYNEKVKRTVLLMDADNWKDLSQVVSFTRWNSWRKFPNEYKTRFKWPEKSMDFRCFCHRALESLIVVPWLEFSADWRYDPNGNSVDNTTIYACS